MEKLDLNVLNLAIRYVNIYNEMNNIVKNDDAIAKRCKIWMLEFSDGEIDPLIIAACASDFNYLYLPSYKEVKKLGEEFLHELCRGITI